MLTSSTVQPSSTPANLQFENAEQEFYFCDEYIRNYDRQWVTIASVCLRVKQGDLWQHGGYHSFENWIQTAAPKSARSIFYFIGLVRDLSPDFSVQELAQMPPETAKVMRKLSTSARRDPAVREAANGKKREFIAAVQEIHPEELIEHESELKLHLEASAMALWEEALAGARILNGDPQMSYEQFLELELLTDWLESKRPMIEAMKCQKAH